MKEIIRQFNLENEVGEPRPVKVGFINDSFMLPSAHEGGKSYFLQRINHHVFRDVEGLQRNIQIVTDHIRKKLTEAGEDDIERKVLQLVPTKDGKLYYSNGAGDEAQYWRVYVNINDSHSTDKVTPESAELAGEAFGRFQMLLSDLPFDSLTESIPHFHDIPFRLQQLDEAIAADAVGRLKDCTELIEKINVRRREMCLAEGLFSEGKLPKRINHCDTKVNNMLFDADGKPLCIVDLDTVMPGFVFSDFGDFMRTAANTGAEDDPNLDNIHVNMDVYRAYTRGYLRSATFLTPIERGFLAYGCRRMSYMQAVRFLTDYINGDTYYKTDYAEHNLVRTRAQIRLLEEQEFHSDEMNVNDEK